MPNVHVPYCVYYLSIGPFSLQKYATWNLVTPKTRDVRKSRSFWKSCACPVYSFKPFPACYSVRAKGDQRDVINNERWLMLGIVRTAAVLYTTLRYGRSRAKGRADAEVTWVKSRFSLQNTLRSFRAKLEKSHSDLRFFVRGIWYSC